MSQKRIIHLIIIYLIINCIFINSSVSTLFKLVGGWEKVSNPAEEYNANDGWATYSIESLQIAKIEILQEGEFCFASKMDSPTPNELYFNNKLIESTLQFKKSNYFHVNKNDMLRWVFSVKDSKGGKVWIAFPTEQISTGDKPPRLISLEPDKSSPQEAGNIISWIVNASDENKDMLLYKFVLNNSERTTWINENTWIWNTTDDVGNCKIGVKVRDNSHAGPDGFDDYRETNFIINPKKKINVNISDLKIQQDKPSPQEVGSVITFTATSKSMDLNNSIYRFILDGRPVTDWSSSRKWKWEANNTHIGVNHIEIQVKDNGTGQIYSTNLSYNIGIIIRDGEDLNEIISSIHKDNVYIFIEGTHIINDILKINNSSIKLIGKSGNAKLVAAREFTKCAISIMNNDCDVMNITLNGFHLGVKLSADNCTIKNAVFSSVGTAIHIKGCNNTSIINNTLYGNDQKDIIVY
jgi:parallel beta-helix repeat protein